MERAKINRLVKQLKGTRWNITHALTSIKDIDSSVFVARNFFMNRLSAAKYTENVYNYW